MPNKIWVDPETGKQLAIGESTAGKVLMYADKSGRRADPAVLAAYKEKSAINGVVDYTNRPDTPSEAAAKAATPAPAASDRSTVAAPADRPNVPARPTVAGTDWESRVNQTAAGYAERRGSFTPDDLAQITKEGLAKLTQTPEQATTYEDLAAARKVAMTQPDNPAAAQQFTDIAQKFYSPRNQVALESAGQPTGYVGAGQPTGTTVQDKNFLAGKALFADRYGLNAQGQLTSLDAVPAPADLRPGKQVISDAVAAGRVIPAGAESPAKQSVADAIAAGRIVPPTADQTTASQAESSVRAKLYDKFAPVAGQVVQPNSTLVAGGIPTTEQLQASQANAGKNATVAAQDEARRKAEADRLAANTQ